MREEGEGRGVEKVREVDRNMRVEMGGTCHNDMPGRRGV